MGHKSIAFIEPMAGRTNVFDQYMKLPLMGPLILGTILHEKGHHVRVLNENVLGRTIDPFEVRADCYCLSSLTPNASRTLALARQFRRIYPQAKILIGGTHASLLPHEFADVADHIVTGEGEAVIEGAVNGDFTDKIIQGQPVQDMDALPLVNYRLLEDRASASMIPIMTSRGCPFDCNFCAVTTVFGKAFRFQSPERVMAEIENALSFFDTQDFFFYDDNLTANHKRAATIFELMAKSKRKLTWSAQVRTDLARNPDLVKCMRSAGCTRVYVGFESIQDETLKDLHKAQTREDIETSIRVFHECDINIHGMFMIGGEHDTAETTKETVEFAIRQEIDTVQFMVLTPLPGTRLYQELEEQDRIFHHNWDYYNGLYVVFRPQNMSPIELQKHVIGIYRRFYSFRRTFFSVVYLIFTVFLDALVFNFRHAYRYDFITHAIRISARTIVNRYRTTKDPYLQFLEQAIGDSSKA